MILDCAAKMLAPGGRIVYSTCTFSYEEDEGADDKSDSMGGTPDGDSGTMPDNSSQGPSPLPSEDISGVPSDSLEEMDSDTITPDAE